MNNIKSFILIILLLAVCSHINVSAQTTTAESKTYDKDGLKFEYPADWNLIDKSSTEIQTLYLTKEKSTVLIIISSPRETLGQSRQFENLQRDSFSKYEEGISKSFSTAKKSAESKSVCFDINDRKISGTRIEGIYNNEPGTGDLYSFALGNRLVTLSYLKIDKESQLADKAWEKVIKSLYTKGAENFENKDGAAFLRSGLLDGGVMNGRALKLVKPIYPSAARRWSIKGAVQVKVVIDENGDVISAKAISGDGLLHGTAEVAAKSSKFQPTKLCDKPVKVDGIIVYNFVP